VDKKRVLILGENTFGQRLKTILSNDYEIVLQSLFNNWDKRQRATEYDLIILDYSVFMHQGNFYKDNNEIFIKEIYEAIEKGKSFCFLHYDDAVPKYYGTGPSGLDEKDSVRLSEMQIGYHILRTLKIAEYKNDSPVYSARVHRKEFEEYLKKWGASKLFFKSYGENKFTDIIYSNNMDYPFGFRIGRCFFLPAQRNFDNNGELENLFKTLIKSIFAYLDKLHIELPSFSKDPIFQKEKDLLSEMETLNKKVSVLESEVKPFLEAKSLLFCKEYGLEDKLIEFIKDGLKLNVLKEERYKEDCWVLDKEKNKTSICEIKSSTKGLKSTAVYKLHIHREEYDLADNFHGILFVNLNLESKTLAEKTRPINKQDYETATKLNMLIVRIEDLLYMWEDLINGRITSEEIYSFLTNNIGWIEYKGNKQFKIYQ
jgi:hypothetical protein